MWCIEICIWCSPYTTQCQWWSTPMCLHIMDLLPDRTELWNLWPQTSISDSSPPRMATLYPEISIWNDNLLRPQEPYIFPKCPENQPTTGLMVPPLSEYDIKLVHLPGSKMILSDTLSWWPDFVPEKDTDNEDIILLPDQLFINLINIELQQEIANTNNLDTNATATIMLLLGKGPTNLKWDLSDWTTKDFEGKSILFYQDKNYIPKDYNLRKKIVSWYHDLLSAGHPGEIETLNAIKEHYWWLGMWTFIKNYVKGCGICQQFKINWNPSAPSFNLVPGPMATRPFVNLSMDLITELLPVTLDNGTVMDMILSIVDHGLMKGVILTSCLKTLTEEGSGKILLHHIYKQFRLPDSIISDQDPQFTAKSFQELLKLLRIKLKLTKAYQPQSDGTIECFNQEIKAYIGIYCSSNPKTWHKSISTMEFTHNSWWHSNWQWTSFKLLMGTSPLAIPTTFEHTKFPSVEEWIQQLEKKW